MAEKKKVKAIKKKGTCEKIDQVSILKQNKQNKTKQNTHQKRKKKKINQRSTNEGFWDELHIVIRKQLSNSSEKYKRIGIVGGVAVVRSLAKERPKEQETGVTANAKLKLK